MEVRGYDFAMDVSGSGEPLIFVHGSMADYQIWQEQQAHFAQEYRTLRYSRRYHWPNEPIAPGADYSMAEHVSDLKAIIPKGAQPPVRLVGHSYGAFVSLLLAMDSPELVRSLVLMEPPALTLFVSSEPKPAELLRLLLRKPRTALAIIELGAKGFGPAKQALENGDMDRAFEIFSRFTLGDEYFEGMSEEARRMARRNMIKAEFLGSGFPPVDPDGVRQVEIPTLLVEGENSPAFFKRVLDHLENLMPQAERVEIPNSSHVTQVDNPEHFRSAVLSFLNEPA